MIFSDWTTVFFDLTRAPMARKHALEKGLSGNSDFGP